MYQQEFPRRKLPEGIFRCPEEGHLYDYTTGRFVGDKAGIPEELRKLRELRCESWDGWVFINQDADAEPLLDWLHPLPEQMAMFQGAKLRMIDKRWTIIPCNWKVTVEGLPGGLPLQAHPPESGRLRPRPARRHHGRPCPTATRA